MDRRVSDQVNHDSYSDDYLRGILRRTKTIAMVGASPNWNRPSYFVMKYLQSKGFRVIPVNPRALGEEILGEPVVASLNDITVPVDLVDVFRAREAAPGIVEDAIKIGAKTVWMQIGVRHDAAAARAEADCSPAAAGAADRGVSAGDLGQAARRAGGCPAPGSGCGSSSARKCAGYGQACGSRR
jgi:predicted CoA-binding protein